MKEIKWLVFLAVGVAATVGGLAAWAYPVENPDCAARYAPMAEAFARGDWYEAFHPRFCILFQILTGSLVWLTNCSGVAACQIVSAAFLGLSVIPYWYIMRRVFDSATAWLAVAILLVLPRISGDAMNGLRDPGRILAVCCWVLGFFNMLDKKRGAAALQALGLFIMVTLKIDCFAPAAAMCMATIFLSVRKRDWRTLVMCASAFVVSSLSVCTMNWFFTGWFVPAPQYIHIFGGNAI